LVLFCEKCGEKRDYFEQAPVFPVNGRGFMVKSGEGEGKNLLHSRKNVSIGCKSGII